MTSAYPPWKPVKRTPEEWAAWWEEFKKRNGLDKAMPHPPEDAGEPPKPHSETEETKS